MRSGATHIRTHSSLPSSKSITSLPSLNVESMFNTCRISELAPFTSSSTTFGGIFSFSLWGQRWLGSWPPDLLEQNRHDTRSDFGRLWAGNQVNFAQPTASAHRLKVMPNVDPCKGFIFCRVRSLQMRIIGIYPSATLLAGID